MTMSASDRPSDDAVLASVAATLRNLILPSIVDEWVRVQTIQLIALVELVRQRDDDPLAERAEQLQSALDTLGTNDVVFAQPPGDPHDVAAAALVACIGRDDPPAAEVRAALRPLLVAHLDDDLAASAPLLDAFRGRLR